MEQNCLYRLNEDIELHFAIYCRNSIHIIIIIINKFICNSTELDSHIQYIQAYKIQGNTNSTQCDTQRDTYKEYIKMSF